MRRPPVIRELQALAKPKGRHVEATESPWLEFVAAITTQNCSQWSHSVLSDCC